MGISRADYEAMQARTMAARGELARAGTDEADGANPEWTKGEIKLQEQIHAYAEAQGAIDLKCEQPWKPSNRPPGEWDHIQLWPGNRTVLIEVKRKKKKRSDAQRIMHARAIKNGHESYLIKTWEGYLKAIYGKESEEPQAGSVEPVREVGSLRGDAAHLDRAGARDRTTTD